MEDENLPERMSEQLESLSPEELVELVLGEGRRLPHDHGVQEKVQKLEVKVDQERMEEGIAFFHKNFFSLFVSMLAGLLSLMYVETIGI